MSCLFRTSLNCNPGKFCSTCGWNPAVEAERKLKLRSGEVKSYLHFDFSKLKAQDAKQRREDKKDDNNKVL